ncbi:MAG: FG-GAP repeat protein, partial [Thermoplasmata archaeon]|nr:FG-GAP repeat protein [Thermoplasmata archaeon]
KDILIFYGDKKDEESGYAVASGDLDNDGRGDIIVGTPRAESANGTLLEVGRIDIIFELNVTSQISHVSYSLVDGGGTNGDICYAGAEHTFRVRVAHSKGITQLNFTQLGLEPLGPNIQFRWYQGNNSFFEISDRFGYASLNTSSSTSRKIENNIYELDFKVIFNFKYPAHRMSAIQFYSLGDNRSVPAAIDKYEDIFQVESSLKFVGELSAVGSYQGKLKEGDRVHSLEKIIWAGLIVVYNGTTDLYPGDEYFDVSVWDDDGDSWTDQYSSGEEIEIVSEADAVDDPSDTHTINITNIPDFGEGLSEVKFEINVEATKIAFTEHKPDSNVWHDTKNITCSIVISDTAGWEINGSSIEYSISTNGAQEDNFSPWTKTGQTGQQMSYSVSTDCEFENGDDNFIRWRTKNVASQIYGGSVPFQVRVDIEPVYYSNPIPAQSEWQYSTSVECGIIVSDNLSGVNKDSIQYRYKDQDMSEFNAFSKDGLTFQENENGYECKVTINFKPG